MSAKVKMQGEVKYNHKRFKLFHTRDANNINVIIVYIQQQTLLINS